MLQTVLMLLFITTTLFSNSLYTDTVDQIQALPSTEISTDIYDYSSAETSLSSDKQIHLTAFTHHVFELSQQTNALSDISNESILYSDINRLKGITNELFKLLGPNKIHTDYTPVQTTTPLQKAYQETIYKLYVLSPYMPYLLTESFDETVHYIQYIQKIKTQFKTNVADMLAVKNKLNMGQHSSLPFSPNTPEQLSFALESQLNASILNMLNTSTSSESGMPYSSIATPPNANLMNQQGGGNMGMMGPMVGTPNTMPLQMMTHMPSF
jgi:hypothetical protein